MSELLNRYQAVLKSLEEKKVDISDKACRTEDGKLDSVLLDAAWAKYFSDRDCLRFAIRNEEEAIMEVRANRLLFTFENQEGDVNATHTIKKCTASQDH